MNRGCCSHGAKQSRSDSECHCWSQNETGYVSQISHLYREAIMINAGKSVCAKQPSLKFVTQCLINPNFPSMYIPFDSE